MRTMINVLLLLGLISGLPVTVFAQQNTPPAITDFEWTISRYAGTIGLIDFYDAEVPFDPETMLAYEKDVLHFEVEITDPDFDGEEGDAIFYVFQTGWIPVTGYPSPEPPPITQDFNQFFPEEEGIKPPAGQISITVSESLEIPMFTGNNQAKLRGLINYDVSWFFVFGVSNSQNPGCEGSNYGAIYPPCEEATDWQFEIIYAAKNPLVVVPNPPPFADAGSDRTVNPGTVILDGSRSIDLYNLGFNTNSSNVFEKDTLTYTWEWISGPTRVNPQQDDPTDPLATVNLVVEGTYVYRLTVDDNVNALPSSDTVTIVITQLADNHPPLAGIKADPSGKTTWTVGETVTLVSSSTDPDDDELSYYWQQTDELGGALPADLLTKVFQPMSGITGNKASWQALLPGTYYFRLLVNDGQYVDTMTYSIKIIDTDAAGALVDNSNGNSDLNPFTAVGGCGLGVLPATVLPLALCLLRRRA